MHTFFLILAALKSFYVYVSGFSPLQFSKQKNHSRANLGNAVATTLLLCCFLTIIRVQATMREQERYQRLFLFFQRSGVLMSFLAQIA